MEAKEELLEDMKWEDVESGNKYANFEVNKPYQIMVKSAKPFRDGKYKDAEGKPKIRVKIEISKLNGKDCDLTWTTGSYTVMAELKKCVSDGSLTRSTFLVKLKNENGKSQYTFEKISELPNANDGKVEAFL